MIFPIRSILAAHTMALAHCESWLALECATIVFGRHAHEPPIDERFFTMILESRALAQAAHAYEITERSPDRLGQLIDIANEILPPITEEEPQGDPPYGGR